METELHPIEMRARQRAAVGADRSHRRDEQPGVEDGRVDRLRLTREAAVVERLDHADRREEAVPGVAERGEAPERITAVGDSAVFVGDAGERASGLVVPRRLGARATVEAARVAVDDVGIDRAQRCFVDLEAGERRTPHVRVHDVGVLDEAMQHREPFRRLEIDADAALAAVGAVRDVVGVPPRIAPRVDLDDVRAEVGEDLRAERSRDREPEVEHGDAFERCTALLGRRRRRRSGGLRIIGARRGRRGFGAQGVGVLADARDRSLDPPRRATQPVHDADLTQRSVLGMFDVGDRVLGAQRGVGERFLRRAHRLQRDAGLGRDTDPLVARERARPPRPSAGSSARGRSGSRCREARGRGRRAHDRRRDAAPACRRRRSRARTSGSAPTARSSARPRSGRTPSARVGR